MKYRTNVKQEEKINDQKWNNMFDQKLKSKRRRNENTGAMCNARNL